VRPGPPQVAAAGLSLAPSVEGLYMLAQHATKCCVILY
jgi:hypothetical protein